MQVTVRLHGFRELGRERTEEVPGDATAADLLAHLAIPTESVLLFRDDEPIPVDAPLEAGETLRVVRIVSGG